MSPAGATNTPTSGPTTTHDEVVHTTANHPWYTADRGWQLGGALRVGEPVARVDGSTAVVVAVRVVPGAAAGRGMRLVERAGRIEGAGDFRAPQRGCVASSTTSVCRLNATTRVMRTSQNANRAAT